jgi:hypothetical protein
VPIDHTNKTLKDVTLYRVTFVNDQTVQLFSNLRGLTQLRVLSAENMNFGQDGDENNGKYIDDTAGSAAAEEESEADERLGAGGGGTDGNKMEETKVDGWRPCQKTRIVTPPTTGHSSFIHALIFAKLALKSTSI